MAIVVRCAKCRQPYRIAEKVIDACRVCGGTYFRHVDKHEPELRDPVRPYVLTKDDQRYLVRLANADPGLDVATETDDGD